MTQTITTAVFPVAGLGVRFLPVTKAAPKEMLPIVDKPLIQYVVEEAIDAGIKKIILVTSNGKRAVEDYFDTNFELESRLEERGNLEALSIVKNILPADISVLYVRQPYPRGLGDAVLCAKAAVGNQAFAVLLADDIIAGGDVPCLQGMIDIYQQTHANVLAVERVPMQETHKYGIVSMAENAALPQQIASIIEKPQPADAPSDLAVTGRYILSPEIFDLLEKTQQGVGGEIQLTDAIAMLLEQQAVIAYPFTGKRYDCGSRMGFLEATIDFALQRPELRQRLQQYLQQALAKTTT